MLDYPIIKKYSEAFDAYYHPFKFGVSWHEKSDQDVLFVYSIVVYGQGMGFGKKLVEEIEMFAKNENCSWISFQDVINPLLRWILAKKGYSRDIEYIGDWEEDQIHWNKKI